MRRLAFLLFLAPCLLPAGEFEWMTREFARQSGTQPLHIPFFGLARFVVGVAHPAGAQDLRLAIFEHAFEHANVRAEQFSRMADSTVGQNWKPIVRVRNSSGEVSNIYVQPEGKHVRVLIATRQNDEVVFVELSIRPSELMKFVDEQRNHHA
jgi:hypothetical protein